MKKNKSGIFELPEKSDMFRWIHDTDLVTMVLQFCVTMQVLMLFAGATRPHEHPENIYSSPDHLFHS